VRERIFRAPGRVNLIGEHTDYTGGFVMPAAIGYDTRVRAVPRADRRIVIRSAAFDGRREFEIGSLPSGVLHDWSDHVRGMLLELERSGIALPPADFEIESDVPIGAGLSSSASVMVAVGFAALALARETLDGASIAQIAQRAENLHAGAQTGIMDPFVSANARAGDALLIDTRSLEFEYLPLPVNATVVICNTMVKHDHATGGYNTRRLECARGSEILGTRFAAVRSLRDATLEQLETARHAMPENVYRRCRHVISENGRTLRAAAALRARDLVAFGKLMDASHASLRDDFEVSCRELDLMVDAARAFGGQAVFGARMTGGGFGGCAIALVARADTGEFTAFVRAAYREATSVDPEIYLGAGAAGAGEIHPSTSEAGL
jgi:galactokinase